MSSLGATKLTILRQSSLSKTTWSMLLKATDVSEKVLSQHLRDLQTKQLLVKSEKTYVTTDRGRAALEEHHSTETILSRLEQISSHIEYIANHFKIATSIAEYGSLIGDAYDNFIAGINNEFETLEQRKIEGPNYHFRSNMLLFSLMMARVYMGLYASDKHLDKLESFIERAKKLT